MPIKAILTVVSTAIAIDVVWISVLTILSILENRKANTNSTVIKPSPFFLWSGVIFTLIWYAVIIYLFVARDDNLILSLLCVAISWFGTALIKFSLNWRIILQENGFEWRNFFRKSFCFNYSDITKIKTYGLDRCWIYCGRRMIAVTSLVSNYEKLTHKLEEMNIPKYTVR